MADVVLVCTMTVFVYVLLPNGAGRHGGKSPTTETDILRCSFRLTIAIALLLTVAVYADSITIIWDIKILNVLELFSTDHIAKVCQSM